MFPYEWHQSNYILKNLRSIVARWCWNIVYLSEAEVPIMDVSVCWYRQHHRHFTKLTRSLELKLTNQMNQWLKGDAWTSWWNLFAVNKQGESALGHCIESRYIGCINTLVIRLYDTYPIIHFSHMILKTIHFCLHLLFWSLKFPNFHEICGHNKFFLSKTTQNVSYRISRHGYHDIYHIA